ncbi:DAK2 domain-containing protein [[Mycoplasma] testudinis]|uniref:DAK2 domain-containing protein n=1 Tax=[Mycoplasma] testudinis TaxID=33924 RepID=UPI000489509E|nr:DAK2 domain-containing protein [[Mycoplasma] testudinis]
MKTIDSKTLARMFEAGAKQISKNFEYINQLNVFPVPDGDTGTNMKITVNGAVEAIKNNGFNSLSAMGKAFARAMLMNARGNSGVIFSQIIKGFVQPFPENQNEITIKELITSFKDATAVSYKSVVQPVEGTILTVIREISEELTKKENSLETMEDLFQIVLKIAKKSLDQTPNLLPDLKIAGVVDSGGFGLVEFLKGMELSLLGKDEPDEDDLETSHRPTAASTRLLKIEGDLKEEGHGYCTEFLLNLALKAEPHLEKIKYTEAKLRKEINKVVNSVVIVSDFEEKLVKLHAHTLEPDKVIKAGLLFGEFVSVKVENMNLQVHDRNQTDEKNPSSNAITHLSTKEIIDEKTLTDEIKMIATAPSQSLGDLIEKNYGVSNFIDTAEFGNPSIGQFLNAIKAAQSRNVIIVIDDTNLILAAKEAIKQVKRFINCELVVGRNFIECMSALSAFMPDDNLRGNVRTMNRVLKTTGSASISSSIKSIKYPHIMVHKDDFIAVIDKKVVVSEPNLMQCINQTMKYLTRKIKKPEIVIVIYGRGISIRQARQVEKMVSEEYGVYCELVNGGQDIYSYLIGIQ